MSFNYKWYTDPQLLQEAKRQYGTFDAIADAMGGVHPTTLAYHWRRMGLPKLPRGPQPAPVNEDALKRLHRRVYGD